MTGDRDVRSGNTPSREWPWINRPDDEERSVRFTKAFHRCTDPKGDFGIGSVRMIWTLRVGDWAIDWDVFTDWGLPTEAFRAAAPTCKHARHQGEWPSHKPTGGAVDWHSPVPLYEGHERSQDHCPVNGGECYLDSGFCLGSDLLDLLCIEGDEAVWTRMRELLDERRLAHSGRPQEAHDG